MRDLIRAIIGPLVEPLIARIPDKNERARAKEKLEADMLAALTSIVQGQIQVNLKEAGHGSVFVAGWRPAIGWICGFGIAWNFIVQPIVMWAAFLYGIDLSTMPELDIGDLMILLGGMLGLGGLRTYEKRLGVARQGLSDTAT